MDWLKGGYKAFGALHMSGTNTKLEGFSGTLTVPRHSETSLFFGEGRVETRPVRA